MSDRSDEATKSRDTDELLSETEDLLSGSGVGSETGSSRSREEPEPRRDGAIDNSSDGDSWWSSDESASAPEPQSDPEPAATSTSTSGSRLSRLASRLSPQRYFSPRTFFVYLLLVGVGLLAGGTVIPLAGQMIGMFGVAFAIGLVGTNRHYLEMGAAGTALGAVSAIADYAVIAIAGSYQAVLAVGVAVGLVACLLGYYFGRDLRNGLSQDIK